MSSGYDDDHPVRDGIAGLGLGTIVLIIVIVLGGVIGGGIWAVNVATSDTRGQGDAIIQKNSATNRISAQSSFFRDYNAVLQFDRQLTDAQAALDAFNTAHPNVGNGTVYDPLAEQQANLSRTVTGLQQQCRRTVAGYNTSAKSYTFKDFRDVELPEQIDETSPKSDCKVTPEENTK